MQFNCALIKQSILAASLALASFTSQTAQATLINYTNDGKELVYSTVSDVTWTKDANLLGTLFASQGFNTVVNAIITASPTISNLPNPISPTGIYTLSASDFSSDGSVNWFGAMGYVNYLNSFNFGGSSQWRLPSVANTITGTNTASNGTANGDELVELFYQELVGTGGSPIPNTAIFDNEQSFAYWSGTEHATFHHYAWSFDTGYGNQFYDRKPSLFYAWAVSPGQIAAVPEPETYAMLLAGLGLMGFVSRRKKAA